MIAPGLTLEQALPTVLQRGTKGRAQPDARDNNLSIHDLQGAAD